MEVPANPNVVVVTTEDISGLVGERQVKDLPLNGRSYDQLLTLNPGAVNYTSQRAGGVGTSNSVVGNMFAVSGRRPQENLFLLNGVEFTSASEINNTPGGVSGQLLGVDAVREFTVVKDTYGAEYGKRPGAQVSIVTASGTNQFHGAVYEFPRNSALDARNFFDHGDIPEFQRNNFGASLGGPLRKRQDVRVRKLRRLPSEPGVEQPCACAGRRLARQRGCRVSSRSWPFGRLPTAENSHCRRFAKWNCRSLHQPVTDTFAKILEPCDSIIIFPDNDSFAAVYTVDDSEAHSPTGNPFTLADISLREQVISLARPTSFRRVC